MINMLHKANSLFVSPRLAGYLILATIFIFVYWLCFPIRVIDVHSVEVLNEDKIVERNGKLNLKFSYTKYIDISTDEVFRHIECVDGNLVTMTSITSIFTDLPKGSHTFDTTDLQHQIIIPQKTSLGECYMVFTNEYKVNPLKTVSVTYETEPFIVIKGGGE